MYMVLNRTIDTLIQSNMQPDILIDAGHFSLKHGPTELDTMLWNFGLTIYKNRPELKKGIILLIDDMHDIESNEERKSFELVIPDSYLDAMRLFSITEQEIITISQYQLKERGRKLLRSRDQSRSLFGQCELIVAMLVLEKQKLGYSYALGIYDDIKTTNGLNLKIGTDIAHEHFSATIRCDYIVSRCLSDNYSNPSLRSIIKS
jgi:hypothetical protein